MGASITLAGESLIAQKQAAQQVLAVSRYVLANVPGLDTAKPVDRAAGKPAANQIVYTANVTRNGYLNPNQVVYSLLMSSDVGDFDFNWIGLETAEGVLLIAAYVPLQQKRKEIPPLQAGNNLTRNIVLDYNGAQTLTGITVPAQTWQFDYTALFAQIDARFTALEAKVDKKLDLDNWTPPALVNLDGPVLVYPGSTNTFKITDYNSSSAWAVASSVGTVSRTTDTVTLTLASNAATGFLNLDITRDGVKVTFKVPVGAAAIAPPTITAPAQAATNVAFDPTLTSSAFQVYPAGYDAHTKTRWQIATDAAFTNLVLDKETAVAGNLRSLPLADVPLRLQPSTRYYMRARYAGATLTSDWSPTVYFNTASVYVRKPTITFPADGATKVSLAGKLTADAFSVYGGADTHQASRWQISTVADFSTVVQDSGWSTSQLTDFFAPSALTKTTQYYARVAYKGATTGQSDWSAVVGFVTAAPLNGNYVLVNNGATGRDTCTLTAIGDALYLAGGYSSAGGIALGKTLWRYDFTTLAWQQKASLAVARSRHAAATVGGKLYLFGGTTDGGTTLSADLTRYDPATDTWQTLQVGPSARAWSSLVELGGDLYVVAGGPAGTGGGKDLWKYTVATNKWTQMADMPAAVGYQAAVAIGAKIYVAAGYNLYIFDAATNTWSTGASPIVSVDRGAGAAVSGFFYTVGGMGSVSGETGTYNHVQEYDPATNKWRRLANFPVTRYFEGAAEYNGSLYVYGGQQSSPNIYANTLYRAD